MPSFREGVDAMSFGWGDKIAPRLGAAYDVRGDGRFKIYGSWGRYYDWTKYDCRAALRRRRGRSTTAGSRRWTSPA